MVSKLERLQRRYEQSVEAAKAAKSALEKLRREQDRKKRIEDRKARTKALIEAGGLVEISDLLDLDKGTLLGALLEIKKTRHDPTKATELESWKSTGDAVLAAREAARKKAKPDPLPDGL